MRTFTAILATALVAPCAAQLKVAVKATNDAGVVLEEKGGKRTVKNHKKNTPFTTYDRIWHYVSNPYGYVSSYVYPPYTYQGGQTYNRVYFSNFCYARKKSGYASLHTTGNLKGDPDTQHHQVDISVTGTKKLKFDWYAYGNIYDDSTAYIKFSIGNVTKKWTFNTPGYNRDNSSFEIVVTNSATMQVEIGGRCTPGATGKGNAYYDGFSTSLSMNILEVGTGSFKTFGTGCSQGKIGAKGTPTKGSYFGVTLKGDKPNTSAALLWGYSKDYYQFFKLPMDLSYMSKGCWLNVSFYYPWYRTTDSSGNAEAGVYLPWYTSGTVYAQWLVWDPKNPSVAPKLSKGAEIKY